MRQLFVRSFGTFIVLFSLALFSSGSVYAQALVNVNTATLEELDTLPGVGMKTAQRFVEAREVSPFTSLEDLTRVKGVGTQTAQKLCPLITFTGESLMCAIEVKPTDAQKINVNTANQSELETIHGVGPTIANNIVVYRTQHGPFVSLDQLTEVPKIGPATLEKMRPFITLDSGKSQSNP